jgi:hypothetical protein
VAATLEAHTTALDQTDENARRELDVYLKLVAEHRKAAAQLQAIGKEMAGARDLPMARHDLQSMASPRVAGVFQEYVRCEQALLDLLQERVEQDRQMLAEMDGAGDGR